MYTTRYKEEIEWYGRVSLCPINQQPCRKTVNSGTLLHPETRNAHHIKSFPGNATPNSDPPQPQDCHNQQTEGTSPPAN